MMNHLWFVDMFWFGKNALIVQSGQVRWYRTWTHGWLILQDQKPVGLSFLPFSSRFDSEIASFLNQITIVIIEISYACKLLIQGLHVWWLQLKFLMWWRNALGGFPPFWIHWRPVTSWNEQLRQITVGTASLRCRCAVAFISLACNNLPFFPTSSHCLRPWLKVIAGQREKFKVGESGFFTWFGVGFLID